VRRMTSLACSCYQWDSAVQRGAWETQPLFLSPKSSVRHFGGWAVITFAMRCANASYAQLKSKAKCGPGPGSCRDEFKAMHFGVVYSVAVIELVLR
jgi:hypothetical protein